MSTEMKSKRLTEKVFKKTISIFSQLLSRKLILQIGDRTEAMTDGTYISIPRSIRDAKIRNLCYEIYVIMEHELSHVVFNTNFNDIREFRNNRKDELEASLASLVYNLVEDTRVESCWNLIYLTPFKSIHRRIILLPQMEKQKNRKLTIIDVAMDVFADFARNKDPEYLKAWKEVDSILGKVKCSVVPRTTKRVAEELLSYIKNHQIVFDCNAGIMEGRTNRDKLDKEAKKDMKTIRFDPNMQPTGNCSGAQNFDMSDQDMQVLRDMLKKYQRHFSQSNCYPDQKRMPQIAPETGDVNKDRQNELNASSKFIEDIRKILVPEIKREKPENRVIGEIQFSKFPRGTPAPVDKTVRALIPFKKKSIRWFSDVGELDVDEWLQRKIKGDKFDLDYFEDQLNIHGMDIIFLVDFSGSMYSDYYYDKYGNDTRRRIGKEFVLKQAIYSLWKSVQHIPGINVKTVIYSGGSGCTTPIEVITNPEDILPIRPEGSTHTYRALDYVHRLIENDRDRRRVIFLLTDGEPTPDAKIQNPYAYVKAVIDRIRRSQIDLFTIFIDNHPITKDKLKYFGNSTNCLYLPPDQVNRYLKLEITKLVRLYTKGMST